MSANPALPILIALLVSLFPIALYCQLLASINRGATPVMVRGVWDFAGVLLAASGILLWTAPAMLTTLYQRSFQRNLAEDVPHSFEAIWELWWLLWAGYYGLLLGGSVLLLWLRRHTTAIYNIQTDMVESLIAATLQRLGFDFAQNSQQQFLIAPAKSLMPNNVATDVTALPASAGQRRAPIGVEAAPAPSSAALEIETFASMCHVTLHWYETSPRIRREIEDELRKSLAAARPADNPAALWQLGIGILLFGAIFLSILFFLLAALLPRP
jgi:hypothetical protein